MDNNIVINALVPKKEKNIFKHDVLTEESEKINSDLFLT